MSKLTERTNVTKLSAVFVKDILVTGTVNESSALKARMCSRYHCVFERMGHSLHTA